MSDSEIGIGNYEAQDDLMDWACAHADELAALDRAAAMRATHRAELIDHETLLNLLEYDPETGVFKWRVNRRAVASAGDIAGSIDTSKGWKSATQYRRVAILGRHYAAHRLAFFYVNGRWPATEIDHINGDGLDNRIANLREAGRYENAQNLRKARKDSSSGLIGAMRCPRTGKWRALISTNHRRRHLGTFETAQEAHEAYVAEKRRVHGTCTI